MFQDYALFPHLDVDANVGFGLRRRAGRSGGEHALARCCELVGMSDFRRALTRTSSRAASSSASRWRARSRRSPALLLLDEPFSNLDPDLRERLAMELREILNEAQTTALLVTHDQYEAFAMADVVGVMQARTHRAVGPALSALSPARQPGRSPTSSAWARSCRGACAQRDGISSVEFELGVLPIRCPDRPGAGRRERRPSTARSSCCCARTT